MDNIQEFFETNLPSGLLSTLTTHSKTYYTLLQYFLNARNAAAAFLAPLSVFTTRLLTTPDIPSVLLLVLILLVSIKLLDVLRRTVIFWAMLALRIAFWTCIAAAVLWLYARGLDGAQADVNAVARIWQDEYSRYARQAETQRLVAQAQRGIWPGGGTPGAGGRTGRRWW